MTSYVVAATPRSGSELFCQLLESTGVAGRPGEWFARNLVHYYLGVLDARSPESTIAGPRALPNSRYLEYVRINATVDGVVSFKIHYNQVEWYEASKIDGSPWNVFAVPISEVPFLFIWRENLLAQAISYHIATYTRVYHRDTAGNDLSFELMSADRWEPKYSRDSILELVNEMCRQEVGWRQFFRANNVSVLETTYEQLVADNEESCLAALRHLGLPEVPPATPRVARLADDRSAQWADRWLWDMQRADGLNLLPVAVRSRLTV